jgi:hypothetical protein
MTSKGTEFVDIPNGRYKANWSGRKLTILLPNGLPMETTTEQPIKGMNVPSAAVIENGSVIVRTLQ